MFLFCREPDFRQLVQRQADERRTQHGNARHVLQRIVQQLQQAQEVENFRTLKKSTARHVERYVSVREFLGKNFRASAWRAQQNDNVTPFDGAKNFFLFIEDLDRKSTRLNS